jgi:transposase
LEAEIQRLLRVQQPEPHRPDDSGIAEVDTSSTPPSSPLQRAVELLDTIPGVDQVAAWTLVAEIGINMHQFGSASQLAKWAGICPGNNESAGKRLSGKTPKGNIWLRRVLCEAAWAASRTKDTYLAAQYKHFIVRKGKKKTIVAVAHSILRIAYYLLTRQCPYTELGGDFFDRLNQEAVRSRLVKKLVSLGYQVTLTPVSSEASA